MRCIPARALRLGIVNHIAFAKGHGTGNDFVVLPDLDGVVDLSAATVRALCDRRTGIGADGVLRIVREGSMFFMDYRNADGSFAQMCGNGIRVFARYLVDHDLAAPGLMTIDTRGGAFEVICPVEGDIEVAMGVPTVPNARAMPVVTIGERSWSAAPVLIPNPHAVVIVGDLDEAGELRDAPEVTPAAVFPDGVNVEFVRPVADDHITMRVFERGVGETRSCGTGACAAAFAARRQHGQPMPGTTRVDVPGGTVHVRETDDGHLVLIGPAVIVAQGHLNQEWWEAHA
jgi:diaminopimelate epimerase